MIGRSPGVSRSASAMRWISLLLSALLVGAGCASDEEKVAAYLEEAAALREAGDYASEVLELRSALQIQPTNADINLLIAESYAADGKMPNAIFYFGEAYRLDPSLTRAALTFVVAMMTEEPERAAEIIEEVLEREPENPVAYMRKTELALIREDVEEALSIALTGVQIAPESATAYRNLGTTYRAAIGERQVKGQPVPEKLFEKALAAFQRAEQLHAQEQDSENWVDVIEQSRVYQSWPDHGDQVRERIIAAFEMASRQDAKPGMRAAIAEAKRAGAGLEDRALLRWAVEAQVEMSPRSIDAWERLVRFEVHGGADREDVLAIWKRAADSAPKSTALQVEYAFALARTGRLNDALAHLDGLGEEIRNEPAVHLTRTRLLTEGHFLPAAEEALEEFKIQHRGDPGIQVAEARLELARGLVGAAIARLRKLRGSAERIDAARLLAEAEQIAGDHAAALASINRAIELSRNPTPVMLVTRMKIRVSLEDWGQVLESYRELVRRNMPVSTTAQGYRVRALYERDQRDAARPLLETMLSRRPPTSQAVLLFVEYEGRDDPARAADLLDAVIASGFADQSVIIQRASLEANQAGPEAALALLDANGATRDDRPALRLARARLLVAMGRTEEAEVDAKAAFEGYPRPQKAPLFLARLLEGQGRDAEAIEYLQRAIDDYRITPRQAWLLGRLHMKLEDLEAAQVALETAIELSPAFNLARNDLAYVLAVQGRDLDRALDLARAAREALPDNAPMADTLGFVYLQRDLHRAALTEFDAAIALAEADGKEYADFYYHRGLVLEKLERPREAARAFDRALAISPDHLAARDARSRLEANAGTRADG